MMADHQHIQMFIDSINRVRACRVSRRGKNIQLTTGLNNIRRMAAAGTFGMVGVNGSASDSVEGRFDKA